MNRTDQTYQSLLALTQTLGTETRLPTFNALKDQLGVSATTLSRVLERLEAEQVLVRRHGVGIFVSPQRDRRHIALICSPGFFEGVEVSPFWRLLMERILGHLRERHYDFSLHFSADEQESGVPFYEDVVRQVDGHRLHGVLGIGLSRASLGWLQERGIPVVTFGSGHGVRVDIDFPALIRMGVEALVQQNCRRIGLWISTPVMVAGPRKDSHSPSALVPIFLQAVEAQGLTANSEWVFEAAQLVGRTHSLLPRTLFEQGFQIAQSVFHPQLAEKSRPDGIITNSELLTQGAMIALEHLGLTIGQDIHFAAHANANSSVLRPWQEQITRLEVVPDTLAQQMLSLLEHWMESGQEPQTPIWHRPRLLDKTPPQHNEEN